MQWLTLVPEDAGVQRLKTDNRKPAVTKAVDALSPFPTTHAVKIGDGTVNQQPPSRRDQPDRRQHDRRSGCDRRCKQVPVLLDTRSSHDRRHIENRRQAAASKDLRPVVRARINLYA